MLLYNLPINEITSYIYCEETKDYFSFFSEEESLDEMINSMGATGGIE